MPYIQDCIAPAAPARGAKYVIRIWLSALIAVLAFLMLGSAVAADAKKSGVKASAKSSAYQEERAACMSMQDRQDRTTCLKEAAAAQQAARRGQLVLSDENYKQNALMRCNVFTEPKERQACERRVLGDGSISGSVEEGGLLRQTTTVEVIQPSSPPSGSQPYTQPGSPQVLPSGRMSSDMMQPGMTQPERR